MKSCYWITWEGYRISLTVGILRIYQTNVHQNNKGMYFFMSWSFGLSYIPFGSPFEAYSLPWRLETPVCLHVRVGLPSPSCGSCNAGQRTLHYVLHTIYWSGQPWYL